jgi:hypothetical protein
VLKATECLIAVGNLRAAVHACIGVLPSHADADVRRAADLLASALTATGPIALLHENPTLAEVALEELTETVRTALGLWRARAFDERTTRMLCSLETSLAVACTVLRLPDRGRHSSGVYRASHPRKPLGQTGT